MGGTGKRPPLAIIDEDRKRQGVYKVPNIKTLIQKSRDLHVYKTGLDGKIDWNEKQLLQQKN